ncbi:hypothetical protein [Cellulomonas sp. Leaf334]|uniref:hypothetical protein n=1 Tax=Cellulomonas sp. Leaf334 TaxID=1736339 RepID=UPI0006F2BD78|nr:hypothetical protein [Cellulomonas sp. Leaf334]KQR17574.1 hypothetical protein ASF78_09930 [Cellulomonas sp. Leaf334]
MSDLTLASTSRATDVAPARETADADMGVPFDVRGDERLFAALLRAGYVQTEGNRFVRLDGHRELVIDVLAPSYLGRLVTHQEHGRLVVDEIPGLQTALLEQPTVVEITANLTDGTEVRMTLLLPDVGAALVMKAHSYVGRLARSDAIDIHRLLEAANVAGRTAQDWPTRVEAPAAAKVLHDRFGTRRPNQFLSGAAAARVRLLVQRVVPAA